MSDKSLENLNRSGRSPGSKNKSTLVKEALRGKWDDLLEKEGAKVFMAVVEKAQDGDMTAAKLILDRMIPVAEDKLSGKMKIGEGGLTIVIEKLEAKTDNSTTIEAQPTRTSIEDGVEDAEIIEEG